MIELDEITLRNFLSWGDYDTVIALSDRGQCFISGPNGAGKSSITQAILWCLSGKTMHKKNPGNGVLNFFSDNDCTVSLRFKGGSELTRIRRRSGTTELLYSKNGRSVIECTLSTTSNQQRQLERELGFDYDIFCGSVFFNQFRHRWLEMSDQARKQTLERIIGIDRLTIYAEVSKKRRDRVEAEQTKLRAKVDGLQLVMTSLTDQVAATRSILEEFDNNRANRVRVKLEESRQYQQRADHFELVDIPKLVGRWQLVEKVKAKIVAMRDKSREMGQRIEDLEVEEDQQQEVLNGQLRAVDDKYGLMIDGVKGNYTKQHKALVEKHSAIVEQIQQKRSAIKGVIVGTDWAIGDVEEAIRLWRSKEGKICSECEQEVPAAHAASKIEPKLERAEELRQKKLASQREDADLVREIGEVGKDQREALAALERNTTARIEKLQAELTQAITKLHEEAGTSELPQKIEQLKADRKKLDRAIESAEEKLANSEPDRTVNEAEAENARQNLLARQADKAKQEAAAIEQESNPHLSVVADLESNITLKQSEIDRVRKDIAKYDLIYAHLHYIYRSYSERKKIKSFMIAKHRPYFNSRLEHYLDSFDLDVKIQLTDSLGLESNLWDYDFQSGGERARTNLVFMFAVFDLHSGIHGRQCNMLVLDEPDHHLDAAGRAMLIDIIIYDLACRFETIFIISHLNEFRDLFPRQLAIKRVDRLSYIDEAR